MTKNSKLEIRNSKQIQMFETPNIPNKSKSASGFENFSNFGFIRLPVCFGFRYLDFGFFFRWRIGARNFLKVILFLEP